MISTGEVGSVSAPGWVPPHGYPRSTMDVSGTEVVKKYMKRKREDFEASAGAVAVAPLSETWKKVCVDCQTSITPLWRTGPSGPKSLCNACGIRYRKRKSAISEQRRYKLRIRPAITNASIIDGDVPSPADVKAEQLMRLQREKQQRLLLLLLQHQRAERSWQRRPKKRSEAAGGIICGGVGGPGKEETEAALLLMSLSSGISVRS